MKNAIKVLMLALAIFCFYGAEAQVQKGKVYIATSSNLVGGPFYFFDMNGPINTAGLHFGKIKYEEDFQGHKSESTMNVLTYNFSPAVGYLITDNIMVGVEAGVSVFKMDEDEFEETITTLAFTPIVRGYFVKEGKFLPYGEMSGGIVRTKFEDEEADKYAMAAWKVGGAYFFGSKASLDLFLDYTYAWDKEEDNGYTTRWTQSMFGVGVGFSLFL